MLTAQSPLVDQSQFVRIHSLAYGANRDIGAPREVRLEYCVSTQQDSSTADERIVLSSSQQSPREEDEAV